MSFFGTLYDMSFAVTADELEAQKNARPRYARELKDIDFNYLRRELDNIRSPSGESLYEHIKRVFEHLILHNPDRALERFEEISYMIKKKMDVGEFLKMEDVRDYKPVAAQAAAYTGRMQPHFAQGEPDDDGNIPQPEPLATQVQDLMQAAKVFQWAGISFGEQETYRLQKSIKKLAEKKPHKSIRFFGKIYGTQRDYYVVEAAGEVAEDDGDGDNDPPAGDGGADGDGEPDPKLEARGTGVNELSYYVAGDSLSDWKRLPDLSYKDLIQARRTNVLFTGDLEREIFTNPFFFGKEKHFLRAQLSRMSHSTSLQPAGVSKLEEDEAAERGFNVVPNEGEEDKPFVMPTTREMSDPGMWVYAKPNILVTGRVAHLPPEEPANLPEGEEFDAEEAKRQQEAADPYERLLKEITEDAPIGTGQKFKQPSWSVRLCGDATEYMHENPAITTVQSNAVVVVRSLVWPGSYTFFVNGKVSQVYLGYGRKFSHEQKPFPVNPPAVMADPEEYEDGPEPTPLEAPPVVAADPDGAAGDGSGSDVGGD